MSPIIFPITIFIVVAIVIASVLISISRKKKRRLANVMWLKDNGKKVQATVTNVSQHTGRTGYNYIQIECAWTDPSTKVAYNFYSDPVFNATVNNLKDGNTVDVFINPSDPTKAYVDIGSIFPNLKLQNGNWFTT